MSGIPTPISLADIVRNTANELRDLKADEVADAVIVLEACEIELAVSAEIAPGGKIKFVVWEAGVESKYVNAQKVVLKFKTVGGNIQASAEHLGPASLPTRG